MCAALIRQGLDEASLDWVCHTLGPHITELSLAGCTQLAGDTLMLRFHDKFPCLHTLNVNHPRGGPGFPRLHSSAFLWWQNV